MPGRPLLLQLVNKFFDFMPLCLEILFDVCETLAPRLARIDTETGGQHTGRTAPIDNRIGSEALRPVSH